MRRVLFLAAATCAIFALPAAVHAQVVSVRITRPYTPVVIQPSYLPPIYNPQVGAWQATPLIAPSYQSTLNIYPQYPKTYSYFATPAYPYPVPSLGVYSASYSSNTGFGPFRSTFSQRYYYP